jgi:hypothetical protein
VNNVPPDFLSKLVAVIQFMRLSSRKGAHVVLSGAAWQDPGRPAFRPTYAGANIGHPDWSRSDPDWFRLDLDCSFLPQGAARQVFCSEAVTFRDPSVGMGSLGPINQCLGSTAVPLSSRPKRTRISCHAAPDISTCAPLRKERHMKFINATKLNRKSGERSGGICSALSQYPRLREKLQIPPFGPNDKGERGVSMECC